MSKASRLSQPNFVFISTDQQRYDTLGCTGSPVARTPHLDRLAAEGVLFHSCYTTNPVCMPARASWFTGQYPSHHGCWQNGVPLDQQADMIQSRLKATGYHTALIGKIHLDNVWLRKEPHPPYGFELLRECEGDPYCKDEYFQWLDAQGLYEGYMAQFKKEGHKAGYTRDLPEDKHMNNWIAGHVEDYFRERAADRRPFFLSVGFFDPHHPFDPCEPYASMFRADDMPMPIFADEERATMTPLAREKREREEAFCRDPSRIRQTIAAYHATITHVDAMVGRLMRALDATGLQDNTVVIFTSDHGELLGDHGLIHKGPFFYENSIRVPLIWRFPARLGVRGVDRDFTSHVDLAPTVARLAGVSAPHLAQGAPLFGDDLRLRCAPARDAALTEWREKRFQSDEPFLVARCLVTCEWKYVHYLGRDFGELYDRRNDPHEFRNLWADPPHQPVVRDMQDRLLRFILESEPCPARTDIF